MIESSTHCYLKMLEISQLLLDDYLCEMYSTVGIYHKQKTKQHLYKKIENQFTLVQLNHKAISIALYDRKILLLCNL